MPDVIVSYQLERPLFNTNTSLQYDVTRGFTAPLARAEDHTGTYNCSFTRGDVTDTQIIPILISRKSDYCPSSSPVCRGQTFN